MVENKKKSFIIEIGQSSSSSLYKGQPLWIRIPEKPHLINCLNRFFQVIFPMKHPLPLIEAEDTLGQPVVILANDFSQPAEEIADIYRNRWQIELFFRWIKQHMVIKHLYGQGEQAVQNQIYIALITYCLLALFKMMAKSRSRSLLEVTRLLRTCLYQDYL